MLIDEARKHLTCSGAVLDDRSVTVCTLVLCLFVCHCGDYVCTTTSFDLEFHAMCQP